MSCRCHNPITFGHQRRWCPLSVRFALDDEECYNRVERDADQRDEWHKQAMDEVDLKERQLRTRQRLRRVFHFLFA